MRGCDRLVEGTGRDFAHFGDVISAAGRTTGDFPGAVEFDVRRQVVWKIDAVAVG